MATFQRLVRFVPKSGGEPLIGEPVERDQDVGLATYAGEPVEVEVFAGRSVLEPGERTGKKEQVERLLSPLAASEVGTIRCIGLNVSQKCASLPQLVSGRTVYSNVDFSPTRKYRNHANEVNLPIPEVPVLFMKPSTALSDPFPAPTVLPKAFEKDDSADYESELAVVLGKDCKNVSEAEAMDYVLG